MEIITKNNIKKYSTYKNSGVEWLGEIPEHWEVKKMKFIGKVYAGISGKKGDDFSKEYSNGIKKFIPFTNICNNLIINKNQYQYVKIDEKENQNRVKYNDILFLMSSETLDDIAKCSIYLGNDKELYLNSFCKGFRITKTDLNPEYVNYLLSSKIYRNYFSLVGRGFTRINLKQEFINNATITIPPLSEQTKIAKFLDDKTKKIDEAIAIKSQQINLLKERKQILIHKAVTRGLDTNVKLKNSGVEWIGEIPVGWLSIPFRRISSLQQGLQIAIDKRLEEPNNDTLEYITTKSIHNPNNPKHYVTNPKENVICDYQDVLLGRTGNTGEVVTNVRGVFHNNFFKIVYDKKKVLKDFIVYYLNTEGIQKLIMLSAGVTTIPDLNHGDFLDLPFILPPLSEQKEISSYIEKSSEKIATAIRLKSEEISTLKEYKSSLINSVVTGKVRVC
ncbi:restriction endonuclease subunit S [Tenacibaculum piscium]|uniref:restriction endonuclease subunit S n=1 Tax=Tenacibaculum piscium TaxID=1458515 RepID=UPI0023B9C94D|nr:restriction endonuclease subunit S [Tenacibaculum piscium]